MRSFVAVVVATLLVVVVPLFLLAVPSADARIIRGLSSDNHPPQGNNECGPVKVFLLLGQSNMVGMCSAVP